MDRIRFLTMTSEEFRWSADYSGILTKEERSTFLTVIKHFDKHTTSVSKHTHWSLLPTYLCLNRQERRGRGSIVSKGSHCLRQIEDETRFLVYPDVSFVTSFTVDRNVTIKGIVLAELDLSEYIYLHLINSVKVYTRLYIYSLF